VSEDDVIEKRKARIKERKRLYRLRPDRKEKDRESFLRRFLHRTYGITIEQYNEILVKQEGLCAICDSTFNRINGKTKKLEPLSVDHCHATGRIRGLLCFKCNIGLGYFQDNPILLIKAIEYLAIK
jgi:hypothetical protein